MVSMAHFACRFLASAPVAQWLALRAYSRLTTLVIPKSRSCEERDGRGFKPLLEHLSFFSEFSSTKFLQFDGWWFFGIVYYAYARVCRSRPLPVHFSLARPGSNRPGCSMPNHLLLHTNSIFRNFLAQLLIHYLLFEPPTPCLPKSDTTWNRVFRS